MKTILRTLLLVAVLSSSHTALAEEKVDPLYVPPPPAPTEPVPDWLKYQDPYSSKQKDISAAHRTAQEIVAWASNTAAEAMSFEPMTFNKTLTDVKPKFTDQGWAQYANWLTESQMADMVRTKKYTVSTVANGDANIVNSASAGGNYHWIVEIPVIITFVQVSADGKDGTPVPGGRHRLTVQLGRVAKGADDTGVSIENWKMSAAK